MRLLSSPLFPVVLLRLILGVDGVAMNRVMAVGAERYEVHGMVYASLRARIQMVNLYAAPVAAQRAAPAVTAVDFFAELLRDT